MLNLSHAVIGASIAASFPNPTIGLVLAYLSHHLADLIPHWDFNTRHNGFSKIKTLAISLVDAFEGLLLGWLLFKDRVDPGYLLAAMLMAQGPDWLEGPYRIFGWHFPPFSWIKKLQSFFHRKLDLPWGLLTQIGVVLLIALASRSG
ncbi:hypothetical protein KKD62_02255 [Patescibacteria group bacterium]|nr:hypothetical protein [Patescibacteria group bacterium]MBU1931691.1 hypothetical protein [Patescibacteria group bacterium]